MNLIDKAVAVLSPEKALARARARRALGIINHYDGASKTRRTDGWRAIGSDANAAIETALPRLRDVSRDLDRNNSVVRRATRARTDAVVGSGIKWAFTAENDDWRKELEAIADDHFGTTAIDADGHSNLYGLQELAYRTKRVAGECLIRRRWRKPGDGFPLPYQIQLLEPEYLDETKNGRMDNGNLAVMGIEVNGFGKRVAYWLRKRHPGNALIFGNSSVRVPATEIIHLYSKERPGQMRGVPDLAAAFALFHDLADYDDAQLLRQKIATCFAMFRTTPLDVEEDPDDPVGSEDPLEKIQPGIIEDLAIGQDVTIAEPPQPGGYGEFMKVKMHQAAAAGDVAYSSLSGDYSQVNFSSARMERLSLNPGIEAEQRNLMIGQMMHGVARWNGEALSLKRAVQGKVTPGYRNSWVPPVQPMLDPKAEEQAQRGMIRDGLEPWSWAVKKRGYDPDKVIEAYAKDAERFDQNGLVFDVDGRVVSAQGQNNGLDEQKGNTNGEG